VNREELAHILRAASTITSDAEIIVLGSQSILGTFDEDELPDEATASMEADIAFVVDEGAAKADQVDGVIGEGSLFQQTHGMYGQGVELSTARLPSGWQDRLVAFTRRDADPASARCLEPHDLVVAKLVAGRAKDYSFVAALLAAGLVSADVLKQRAAMLDEVGAIRERVAQRIDRLVAGTLG
jgi:hypothetical protein